MTRLALTALAAAIISLGFAAAPASAQTADSKQDTLTVEGVAKTDVPTGGVIRTTTTTASREVTPSGGPDNVHYDATVAPSQGGATKVSPTATPAPSPTPQKAAKKSYWWLLGIVVVGAAIAAGS